MLTAQQLARLIAVLRNGETLAASTAARQASLAPLPWMRRALATQAAQERQHAAFADAALAILGRRATASDAIAPLRTRLDRDLARGDLTASVIGLHGVVEHLGEALLARLGARDYPAASLLKPLRLHVLAQERGHVQLGARCLTALGGLAATCDSATWDEYAALGRSTALAVAELLDEAHFDADAFWADVQARLAAWHTACATAP